MFWNNRSLAEAVAFFPFLPSFFGKLDSEHASDVIDCQFPGLVATMSRKRKQNGTNYRGKQRHHHNMLCDKWKKRKKVYELIHTVSVKQEWKRNFVKSNISSETWTTVQSFFKFIFKSNVIQESFCSRPPDGTRKKKFFPDHFLCFWLSSLFPTELPMKTHAHPASAATAKAAPAYLQLFALAYIETV